MVSKIADFVNKNATQNVIDALNRARESEDFNSVLSLAEDRALDRAARVDSGEITGRLAGVPFIAKDNFLTIGSSTTAASKMLENFQAPLRATAIEKLEAEGAICIGKANLDAFAHGGSTENSAFGPTLNAIDKTKVAGGSSGGSAVAVALGIVPFALGTDTGGSIRQPASFNGVVGLKPTYGAVSRYGVVAMASSTDCIGPITNNVKDAELVMEILSGRDDKDMTTLDDYFVPYVSDTKQMKVGLITEYMSDDVDSEVRDRIIAAADKLREQGNDVEEVSIPMLQYALAMYYIIVPAEISSNMARYDGVRYGRRAESTSLADLYGLSRDEGFENENKRRIMIGTYVLSSGFFEAYFLQAQKARTLLINEFKKAFSTYDVLLGPAVPTPAFGLGENTEDPVKMYLADIMTVPANLVGCPAISIPAGVSKSGLPIGAQLMAWRGKDAELLAIAHSLEQVL